MTSPREKRLIKKKSKNATRKIVKTVNVMGKMDEYIHSSLKESKQKILINNIYTFIKDPLPEGFDLDYVLETVKDTIPETLGIWPG